MDFVVNNMADIMSIIGQLVALSIAVASILKALKSELRVKHEMESLATMVADKLKAANRDIEITRAGIVQGFKDAVVTKDVKVSINTQVKKVLEEELEKVRLMVQKSEERRTQMMYWALKIMRYTAASNKLTTEQQTEIDELMALIADDEKIIDTSV